MHAHGRLPDGERPVGRLVEFPVPVGGHVMTRVLVLYASTHGHTGRIAARIAEAIGSAAELREIDSAPDPASYDAVVVGASVHAGHHQKAVLKWVRAHADALNQMPSAFFSVCLAAADDTDEARASSQQLHRRGARGDRLARRGSHAASRARSSTASTTSSPAC